MIRLRRPMRLPVFALIVMTTLSCGQDSGPQVGPLPDDVGDAERSPRIVVIDNAFDPDEVVIPVGDVVTWEWTGRAIHDISGPGFKSEIVASGTFSHAFDASGAYPYVCTLHPGMHGVIYVVEP